MLVKRTKMGRNKLVRIGKTCRVNQVNWSSIRWANRVNITNIRVNIRPIHANQTNIDSICANIRPICWANHKVSEQIRRITNRIKSISWFTGANITNICESDESKCPIRRYSWYSWYSFGRNDVIAIVNASHIFKNNLFLWPESPDALKTKKRVHGFRSSKNVWY